MLLALCLVATSCSFGCSDTEVTQKTALITRIEHYQEDGYTCTVLMLNNGNIITFRNVVYSSSFSLLREGDEITYEINRYGRLSKLICCKFHNAE